MTDPTQLAPKSAAPTLRAGAENEGLTETKTAEFRRASPDEGVALGSGQARVRSHPERLGRYLILTTLGEGGMGVVYTAYDPQLDRKVAIKLLRGRATEAARSRLQREAQAMAQLSHPNVVPVFDVGAVDGQVFVAMDFVVGQTLGAWLSEETRSWAEILEVFDGAGRGLAHAHEHAIVHRDFKPDNAMVSFDGGRRRVQVLDFGLAKSLETEPVKDAGQGDEAGAAGLGTSPAGDTGPSPTGASAGLDSGGTALATAKFDPELVGIRTEGGALSVALTQVGAVMGTPGYMSPEQFLGRPADARSDQFSFCVALYEALYGRRPFEGKTFKALAFSVVTKDPSPPPPSKVPKRLWPILARGLAREPEERWPDMGSLLFALGDDPSERRRAWVLGGVAVAAFAGAVTWGALRSSTEVAPPPKCQGAAEAWAAVYSDDVRAGIHAGYAALDKDWAPAMGAEVEREFDRWGAAWVAARTEACEASEVAGEQSVGLMDLRIACYDRVLTEVAPRVALLAEADPEVLVEGVPLISSLAGFEICADAEALRASYPPPEEPAIQREVAAIRDVLGEVDSLLAAGKSESALALAETLLGRAEATDYLPVVAEARYRYGRTLAVNGKQEAARETLEEVVYDTLALREDKLVSDAIVKLVFIVGYDDADYEAGMRWARLGAAIIDRGRAHSARTRQRAKLADRVSTVELQAGHLSEALTAGLLALELRTELVGDEHSSLVNTLNVVGAAHLRAGQYTEAGLVFERALAIGERAYGSTHPEVAYVLNNLGMVRERQAKFDDAALAFARVVTILEVALGADHPTVGVIKMNLGGILTLAGRLDEAGGFLDEAIEIIDASVGGDHLAMGRALTMRGHLEARQGDHDKALASYRGGLAIREANLGPEHVENGLSLLGIGRMLTAKGATREAIAPLERAVRLFEDGESDPIDRGQARFALARALAEGEAERVEALLTTAREDYEIGGVRAEADLEELERWVAAR